MVQYSSIPDKESFDKNKTLGQLKVISFALVICFASTAKFLGTYIQVLAVSWDETLGGNAFTEVVTEILKVRKRSWLAMYLTLSEMISTSNY